MIENVDAKNTWLPVGNIKLLFLDKIIKAAFLHKIGFFLPDYSMLQFKHVNSIKTVCKKMKPCCSSHRPALIMHSWPWSFLILGTKQNEPKLSIFNNLLMNWNDNYIRKIYFLFNWHILSSSPVFKQNIVIFKCDKCECYESGKRAKFLRVFFPSGGGVDTHSIFFCQGNFLNKCLWWSNSSRKLIKIFLTMWGGSRVFTVSIKVLMKKD